MKIGMILHPYGEKMPSGLGRAVLVLAKAIMTEGRKHSFEVYVQDDSVPLEVPGAHFRLRSLKGRPIWRANRQVFDQTPDVYIFFTPVIPLLFRPKRSIVIAHDFAYLEFQKDSFNNWLRRFFLYLMHRRSLQQASVVVAISESIRQTIIRDFHIAPEKVYVIYDGYIALGEPAVLAGVPEKFFLYPGTLKERKNIPNIIRGFAEFIRENDDELYQLVITGKTGGSYYEYLQFLIRDLRLEKRVQFVGYVSDRELAYLYAKATALVFPSLLEGFGMPVLEAMNIGLPVITSNRGALAEVAGDAAVLVDPFNVDQIADAMGRLSSDQVLRAELIVRGHERTKEFSWEKAAKDLLILTEKIN